MILLALFYAAFLAATILPVGSEPALSAALAAGVPAWQCLIVATLGNSLGSLTTYGLGRLGRLGVLRRYCGLEPARLEAVRIKYGRYGAWAAFFTFLPLIGDLLAAALGVMRFPLRRFTLVMTAGKCLRYLGWIWLHGFFSRFF